MKVSFLHGSGVLFFALINISLQGQPFTCGSVLPAPTLSASQLHRLDSQLQAAKVAYQQSPQNADALIWYARRLGYLGRYQEAIEVLSQGIQLHPSDARMYRHRGHRYLTLRCTGKAIEDFEKAAQLVVGKPDETEPDGQPNDANIPTSTLQSNIYYHLALAYYLQKDYAKAKQAYDKCLQVSTNPDMYTATANWYYLTLCRLGLFAEANDLLNSVDFKTPLLENGVYRQLLLLHRDKPSPAAAMQKGQGSSDVQSASYLYGLYMYLFLNKHEDKAAQVKKQLLQGNQYASFGYIAAEME